MQSVRVAAGATEGIVRGSWDEEPPEPELEPDPADGETGRQRQVGRRGGRESGGTGPV